MENTSMGTRITVTGFAKDLPPNDILWVCKEIINDDFDFPFDSVLSEDTIDGLLILLPTGQLSSAKLFSYN